MLCSSMPQIVSLKWVHKAVILKWNGFLLRDFLTVRSVISIQAKQIFSHIVSHVSLEMFKPKCSNMIWKHSEMLVSEYSQ